MGDTAASLIGRTWGKTKIGDKSLEGLLGFVVFTALVAVVAHSIDSEYPLVGGLVAAVVAGLVEMFIPRIDDNFSSPVAAGATMWMIQSIFG